jgi:hypothetical protein
VHLNKSIWSTWRLALNERLADYVAHETMAKLVAGKG